MVPDELVLGIVHQRTEIAKILTDAIAERLRVDALGLGRLLHLLAVLVGAGEKFDVAPIETLKASQNVARKRGVGVANVRHIVDVINGRRDVVAIGRGHTSCTC